MSSKSNDQQDPSDFSEVQASSTDGEKRRQSTAFVVSLENSEQAAQMSLSSSLPSFQINDHLCSYFPVSRKMSLQKREASVRRKQSLEATDRNLGSDAASEHGTYVIDLDLDDDINEDDFVQMTFSHKKAEIVQRKCSPLKETACQVRFVCATASKVKASVFKLVSNLQFMKSHRFTAIKQTQDFECFFREIYDS